MTDGVTDIEVKKVSYKFDIAFISVFLVVCVGQPFFVSYMEYRGGMANECGWGFLLWIMYWPLKLLLLSFWSILGLVRIFIRKRTIKNKLKAALIILPFFFLLIPPVYDVAPLAPVFLKGYEKWVTKNMNTDAIKQWLAKEGDHYKGQQYIDEFPKEFPVFLTKFKPHYIYFDTSKFDGTIYIEFEWGGGMAHWGVRIGPPNMKIPQEEESMIRKSTVEFRRIIAPGVYIFERG